MKTIYLSVVLSLITCTSLFSQSGEVWPIVSSQNFDLDENYQITKEYDSKTMCSFFMFINNNEFLHATDNITSLYKIIKRSEDKTGAMVYTVASEVGNVYTYSFSKDKKDVIIFTKKGYGIYYKCLTPYNTTVFDNINK
jgi:hypothetical protein